MGVPTVDFSLMTYNTMLLPKVLSYAQAERAALIAPVIAQSADYDIICINEGFDNHAQGILSKGLQAAGYKHVTPVVNGPSGFSNGGVFLASRHALDRFETTVYPEGLNSDKMANKGAQFVRLRKDGLIVYIAITHLQSSRGSSERKIRADQLSRLSAMLSDFTTAAREEGALVLIAGDLNICAVNDSDEYAEALRTMRAQLVAPRPEGSWTSDPEHNSLCHYRYPHEPQEWLDYILQCNRGVPVQDAKLTLVEPQSDYRLNGTVMRDLSDHYALSARMTVRTDLGREPDPEDDEGLI